MSSYLSSRAKRSPQIHQFAHAERRGTDLRRWESGVARSCAPRTNLWSLAHKYSDVYHLTRRNSSPAAISNSAKYLDGAQCCFVSRTFLVSQGNFQAVFRQTRISQGSTKALYFKQQGLHAYPIVADAGLLQFAPHLLEPAAQMNTTQRAHRALKALGAEFFVLFQQDGSEHAALTFGARHFHYIGNFGPSIE